MMVMMAGSKIHVLNDPANIIQDSQPNPRRKEAFYDKDFYDKEKSS